jgi:hypothetical protein
MLRTDTELFLPAVVVVAHRRLPIPGVQKVIVVQVLTASTNENACMPPPLLSCIIKDLMAFWLQVGCLQVKVPTIVEHPNKHMVA